MKKLHKEKNKDMNASFDCDNPILGISTGEVRQQRLKEEYQRYAQNELKQVPSVAPIIAQK